MADTMRVLSMKPRTAPYQRSGPSTQKRRLRIQFEADVEREYAAGQPRPLPDIATYIAANVAGLTVAKVGATAGNLLVDGVPVSAANQKPWVVSLETLPSSGPQYFLGPLAWEMVAVRVVGQAKSDDVYGDVQDTVRAVYDLFLRTWDTEIVLESDASFTATTGDPTLTIAPEALV